MQTTTFHVPAARLVRWLSLLAGCLLIADGVFLCLRHGLNHDRVYGLARLFDFDLEFNIPSLFSTFLIILNALLFLALARAEKHAARAAKVWYGLAGVFFFLALDEGCGLHEGLIEPVRAGLNLSGAFHFAWIVPYGLAVIILGAVVLPTFLRLPRRLLAWFVLAAAAYLTGAIGMEMLSGWRLDALGGSQDAIYGVMVAVEEGLEMAGQIVLSYALMSMLAARPGGVALLVPEDNPA